MALGFARLAGSRSRHAVVAVNSVAALATARRLGAGPAQLGAKPCLVVVDEGAFEGFVVLAGVAQFDCWQPGQPPHAGVESGRAGVQRYPQAGFAQRDAALGGGAGAGVLGLRDPVEQFAAVRPVHHVGAHQRVRRLEQGEAAPDAVRGGGVSALGGLDFRLRPRQVVGQRFQRAADVVDVD